MNAQDFPEFFFYVRLSPNCRLVGWIKIMMLGMAGRNRFPLAVIEKSFLPKVIFGGARLV